MYSHAGKRNTNGLIFNIQRFSLHDGPGIRTTVFMKGCPLKCLWCANPESQDFFPNLMARDVLCTRCGACALACGRGAIAVDSHGRHIDRKKCDSCMRCVASCLYGALTCCGRHYKVEEVLDEVLKDRDFYRNSGGGITVSGGEPLSQAEFVRNLMESCRQEGIHTTLDTSGYAPWETLESVLSFVDLVLFDIKHLDPEKHKVATGVDSRPIMKNLQRLSKNVSIWLRIPLIAGFNDSKEEIEELVKLGKRLGVEKISFLPYHEGSLSKNLQLGRKYPLTDALPPSPEHLNALKMICDKEGLAVSIGK